MTDRISAQSYEYDVALSFAGEDRSYVEHIAQLLRSRNVRVFYDEFMTAELWGRDLYVLLDEIYRTKSRFTVIFASKNYVKKAWTSHERQSAQARALNEPGAYLLPVRLDDSEIPGLRPTVAYVDARKTSPERLVDLIKEKLGKPLVAAGQPILGVPRSLEEKARLLVERPDAWEYVLFAGTIFIGKQALSSKIRDYELGYAPRIGPTLPGSAEAMSFLRNEFDDAIATNDSTMKILSPASQEWAFGRPGEPGDPGRIDHLARRLVGAYESSLDRVARLRGVAAPHGFEHLFQLAAQLNEQPTNELSDFLDTAVNETDRIPTRLLGKESVTVSLRLVLTVDDGLVRQYEKEQKRVRRRFRI